MYVNACPDLLHYLAALEDIGIRGIRQGRNLKRESKIPNLGHLNMFQFSRQLTKPFG